MGQFEVGWTFEKLKMNIKIFVAISLILNGMVCESALDTPLCGTMDCCLAGGGGGYLRCGNGCECKSRNGDISDCHCYTVPGLPPGSCQKTIIGSWDCPGSGSGQGGQVGGGISAGVGVAPADSIFIPARPQKPRPLREKVSSIKRF